MEASDYGCVYAKNLGICRRIPGISEVAPECEKSKGRCVPRRGPRPQKKEPEKKPTTKLVPTPVTLKKLLQQKEPEPLTPGPPDLFLSGPVSAYSGTYKDKKLLFFGDAHFSMANRCGNDCKDINPLTWRETGSENCVDIVRYLKDLFDQGEIEGKYTDFALEAGFTKKENLFTVREDIYETVSKIGYIPKILSTFWECFFKNEECPYRTTRFHYVDLRLGFKEYGESGVKTPEMLIFGKLMEVGFPTIQKMVMEYMIAGKTLPKNPQIEYINKLIKQFYQSGGRTMAGTVPPKNVRLFQLYFDSDDIVNDINNLFGDLFAGLTPQDRRALMESMLPSELVVEREGKKMYRLRAQLWALEKEGKGEIAAKIRQFFMDNFSVMSDSYLISKSWGDMMKIYNMITGQTKTRFMRQSDLELDLSKVLEAVKSLAAKSSAIVKSNSYIMDAYFLARMFRTFPGTGHVDSSTIIAYAGASHIKTYVRFFESLGSRFVKHDKKEEGKEYIRCLHVNKKDFSSK